LQRDFDPANLTLESVLAVGIALNGRQGRSRFIRNPTTGALEDSANLRLEANRAIIRKLRLLKLDLYLSFAHLCGKKFLLCLMRAHLQMVRDTNSYLFHLRGNGHA